MTGGPIDLETYRQQHKNKPLPQIPHAYRTCMLSNSMAMDLAFGRTALMATTDAAKSAELQEKLIMQGLKDVAMHEVGHTLGLRHNFKASTLLSLEDLNNPEKTKDTGLASSVMDYAPANIVEKGIKQGDFYSTTIGPYDYWAIDYGYRAFSSSGEEKTGLKKIASRSGEPSLAYATDEDTRGIDPDPYTNRHDLGKDPMAFAQRQAKLSGQPHAGHRGSSDGGR